MPDVGQPHGAPGRLPPHLLQERLVLLEGGDGVHQPGEEGEEGEEGVGDGCRRRI